MTIDQRILSQLTGWLDAAKAHGAIRDHNAMMLATVGADGQPSARIVLLRDVDAEGLVFYTNYLSHKSQDISENPKAALTFYWEPLMRQVRVEGEVTKISAAQSDAYFAARPRGSQIGAWASEQSAPLENREALEARITQLEAQYQGKEVPRPPHWGGWRLVPNLVEFWQEGDFRLHVRDVYRLENGQWRQYLLNP